MNTKLATTQIRITEWAAIIKDCKSSGMKVDDYCQLHDISRDAYYYWLRKVKTAALQQAGFVELPMPETKPVLTQPILLLKWLLKLPEMKSALIMTLLQN